MAVLLGLLAAVPASEPAGSPARDLALAGQRQLEAGDLGAARASLSAARRALEEERPYRQELADFVELHLYNLGVKLNNAGDAEGALGCFVESLQIARAAPASTPSSVRSRLEEAALAVASYLAASPRPEGARRAFDLLEASRGAEPRFAAAIAAGRGRIALHEAGADAGRLQQAVAWLRRARELEPGSAERCRILASTLVRLAAARARGGQAGEAAGLSAEAEGRFREAIAAEPDSPWARLDLGTQLIGWRRYEEAASLLAAVESRLSAMISSAPRDRDAGAWRRALAVCRENRAVAGYNLAVDAINRARFSQVEPWLSGVCENGAAWEQACRDLRRIAAAREKAFGERVASHEKALAADPKRASDLLALGDLYANLEEWDKAIGYYRRLEAIGAHAPGLQDRLDAVRDAGRPEPISRTLDLPGGQVALRYFREAAGADLETALKAAWLRVSASLGAESLVGPLGVTLYPNRRAFRQNAGYRVGGLVKGNYRPGEIALFETSSQTVLEWVSVVTHELAHHAVENLSGGAAPRWLSEGVARYVEGETAVVDRARLRRRLAEPGIPALSQLDESADRSWNDVEIYLDVRDGALLAVEEMGRRGGAGGLKEILRGLREPSGDMPGTLRRVIGLDPGQVDAAWRDRLVREVSAPGP